MGSTTWPVERRSRENFREEVALELSHKKTGSNESHTGKAFQESTQHKWSCDTSPFIYSLNKYLLSRFYVNRRHGSASRSALSGGKVGTEDPMSNQRQYSTASIIITTEGLPG